jgi:O-antigen/teichoic acid export membrane protein
MKDLAKWQIISFVSRGVAMGLGIVQSFFIVRLLTVSEWGIVQIAISLGGALGIYQHLGLASASTREISAAKSDKEIFKIFVTSVSIRYMATVPIALGLFFISGVLANDVYGHPELALPFKLYAVVLLFQGFQSILNAVIAGTQRFRQLFLYQAIIAAVSLILYIPLVFLYKVNGFFYALFLFNIIATITLGILAFKPLRGSLELPSKSDFKRLYSELISISFGIYIVKIIYTNWEKFGPNVLGLTITPEIVGYFGFALLFAKKLMNVSDAVTDVNLPVFSERYANDIKSFKESFSKNFDKIFVLIILAAATAVYWSADIVRFAVGGDKYDPSLPLILPMVFAFVFYSMVNIIKSSVIIPAKLVKEMIASFVVLIGVTAAVYFLTYPIFGNLEAMAYAMVLGAAASFLTLLFIANAKLKYKFFNHDHVLILIQGFVIAYAGVSLENFFLKAGAFLLFMGLFVWSVMVAKFVQKKDIQPYLDKLREMRRAKK